MNEVQDLRKFLKAEIKKSLATKQKLKTEASKKSKWEYPSPRRNLKKQVESYGDKIKRLERGYTHLLKESMIFHKYLHFSDSSSKLALIEKLKENKIKYECPRCSDGFLIERYGKYGAFFACSNKCGFTAKSINGKLEARHI